MICSSQKSKSEQALKQLAKVLGQKGTKVNKMQSLFEVKQLCNRVMKSLREELAQAHTISIKMVNSDLIEYEQSLSHSLENMKKMTQEQLIREVQQLKHQILSLRQNEIFMMKCSDQVNAVKKSLTLCNFQSLVDCYSEKQEPLQSQKVLKTLNELLDQIDREVK